MKNLPAFALSPVLSAVLLAPAYSQAQAPITWQMPSTEKTQWLRTLQAVAPTNEWIVTNQGNDFVVEHKTPVPFYKPAYINPFPGGPQSRAKIRFEQNLRLTLRFLPLVSEKEWLKRENENVVAQEANEQLMKKFQIRRAFGIFIISGQDAPVRLQKYQNEAQKLISYRSPQLYLGDRSVLVSRSWTEGDVDVTTPAGVKCAQVLESIHTMFKAHQKRMSYIHGVPLDENSHRSDIFWLNLDEETANSPVYPVKVTVWSRPTPTP